MTATRTFHFGQDYTLRPATEADALLAKYWTAVDPFHCDTTLPQFWTEQADYVDSYLLEDADGPIFFLKICRLTLRRVELHIQFPPGQRERLARALVEGFAWLEGELARNGIWEAEFESTNPPLKRFAVRRLGFENQKTKFLKILKKEQICVDLDSNKQIQTGDDHKRLSLTRT